MRAFPPSKRESESEVAVNSAEPNLFEHNNTTDWNRTSIGDDTAHTSSSNAHVNAFFILPALGLLVSIAGFIYLRRRRETQSEQSAEILHARIRAHYESARKQFEVRTNLVESALVTTKVVARHKSPSERRSSFTLTDGTMDSSSRSSRDSMTDLDKKDPDIEAQLSNDQTIKAMMVMALERPMDIDFSELEQCVICQEPYQENESVSYSKHQNCNHVFHTGCIWNWLQEECRNDCPVCRSQYVHACVTEMSYDIFEEDVSANPVIATEEEPVAGENNRTMDQHTEIANESQVEHDQP